MDQQRDVDGHRLTGVGAPPSFEPSGARATRVRRGAVHPRAAIAVTVLAAWVAGIALFIQRERNRSPMERLAEDALRVVPGVNWYEVTHDGRRVGFASIGVDTAPRELDVTRYLVWDAGAIPAGRRVTQTIVHLSRALALRGVSILRTVGADTARLEASAESDSVMRIVSDGDSTTAFLAYHLPAFTTTTLPVVAPLRERPRPGATSTMDVVDADRRSTRKVTLRIAAESLFTLSDSAGWDSAGQRWRPAHRDTVRAWRYVGMGEDSTFDAWVDALGQVVQERLADGLVLHRTAYELAFENWRQAAPGPVSAKAGGATVASTWLAAGGKSPPTALDSLSVRIRSIPGPGFTRMFGRRYRPGSTILLTRPTPRQLQAHYVLPGSPAWRNSLQSRLGPSALIEADAPAIVALARRLRGSATDPAVVVAALLRWVHDSIGRDASLPPAGALETLRRRAGDCNEFTRLFVALARASGIPARPLAGLLYANGHFYYHAWAEVLLEGYVPVDPLLDELPAGAGHLRFGDVGPDLQSALMPLLARLDLDVMRRVPGE